MICLDKDRLEAYLEDALSLQDKQRVQNHLLSCCSCQLLFEKYLDELETNEDGFQEDSRDPQTEIVIQQVMVL